MSQTAYKKRARLALVWCAGAVLLAGEPAVATMYKYVDEYGNVTYSNIPIKGAKRVNLDPMTTVTMPRSSSPRRNSGAAPQAEGPMQVAPTDQRRRDDARRRLLENELAAEQKQLEISKKNLAEGEAPRPDEKDAPQKHQERVAKLKEQHGIHTRNVENLKKELGNLK